VLSDFNNSKDTDYKENNKEKVSNNKEIRDLSKVKVNKSNKNNNTVAGDNRGKVSTVKSDKNISRKESYQGVEKEISNDRSESITKNNNNKEIGII
jgi:hypothetical protein